MPEIQTSRLDTLNTLRSANIDNAFANAFVSLFGGAIIVGFIKYLGGPESDFWVGLVGAVPALMGLLQIPGAVLGRSKKSFKNYIAVGGWIWRLLYLPLVFLPFLPFSNQAKLVMLIGCVGMASVAIQLVGPIYNEWLGKIIPENNRGWFFSNRSLVATVAGLIAGLVGGRILDTFKDTPNEHIGYTIVFAIGFACAIVSMLFYLRMKDTVRENPKPAKLSGIVSVVRTPWRDKNFRKVMFFIGVFCLGQSFAGNLFSAYALESLDMPFTVLQLTGITFSIGTILTVRIWGYLADKYGNKPILVILTAGLSITPLMWIFTNPSLGIWNAVILISGHILPGIFWPGIATSQMNLYLATSEPEERADYLATALTVQSMMMFVAPMAGSLLMSNLRAPLGVEWAYKWIFILTMVFRLAAMFSLIPIREEGATSIRATFRSLVSIRPKGVKALRGMRSSQSEDARESAVRAVGQSQMALATVELASALQDPSPKVRRQAAESLGHVGTPEAAQAMIDLIETHPELVEEETLVALGWAKNPASVRVLVKFLDDPSPIFRRAAARALGRLGEPSAIEALAEQAQKPGDPDLRRACIQALRMMEADKPDFYADALFDQHPSVRIAAAEAVSELEIVELAPNIRQALEWFHDEGSSEVAYSLGAVGSREDIPAILTAAEGAIGAAKRRRCLLGVARLVGVEAQTYRIFAMDAVARDTQILQKSRTHMRKDSILKSALELYSVGSEADALKSLAENTTRLNGEAYTLRALADQPIEEGFLVAWIIYMQKAENQSKR